MGAPPFDNDKRQSVKVNLAYIQLPERSITIQTCHRHNNTACTHPTVTTNLDVGTALTLNLSYQVRVFDLLPCVHASHFSVISRHLKISKYFVYHMLLFLTCK